MKILITGSPGVGKSNIAKELAKKLKMPVLNEKDFALKQGIGEWDHEENELVVPLEKLEKGLKKHMKGQKNAILEGHLLCEIGLPVDIVMVIRVHPELLETRLELKKYSQQKIYDNVFCEGIDYCKKHAFKNYSEKKIVEIKNEKGIKEALSRILKELRGRKLIEQKN